MYGFKIQVGEKVYGTIGNGEFTPDDVSVQHHFTHEQYMFASDTIRLGGVEQKIPGVKHIRQYLGVSLLKAKTLWEFAAWAKKHGG